MSDLRTAVNEVLEQFRQCCQFCGSELAARSVRKTRFGLEITVWPCECEGVQKAREAARALNAAARRGARRAARKQEAPNG